MKTSFFVIVSLILLLFSCIQKGIETKNKIITDSGLSSLSIDILYERADTLYKIFSFNDAMKYLDEIINRDSLQGKAFFKRAKVNAALLRFESSNNDYQVSINLGYHTASCYYNLGCNFMILGEDSKALEYFNKALEIEPHHEKSIIAIKRIKDKLKS
jgi:tetratricopeptide (TPR) repeat protein